MMLLYHLINYTHKTEQITQTTFINKTLLKNLFFTKSNINFFHKFKHSNGDKWIHSKFTSFLPLCG